MRGGEGRGGEERRGEERRGEERRGEERRGEEKREEGGELINLLAEEKTTQLQYLYLCCTLLLCCIPVQVIMTKIWGWGGDPCAPSAPPPPLAPSV